MTLSYVIVMPNLQTSHSVRVNLHVTNQYLRKLLRFFGISDCLIENFSATQWYSQWLECLQEAAWTFICRFTHHVKSLLEADDVCFDVQVWSHLEQVDHGRRHQRDKLDVQVLKLLSYVAC